MFVANIKSDTLSVIDTASDTRIADIPVGKKPVQVAFSPDNRFVYASLMVRMPWLKSMSESWLLSAR